MANALEKYFGEIGDLTGFNPEVIKEAGDPVMNAVSKRNDPTSWMAYGLTAIKQAWSALPKAIRQQMYNAINDVIQAALEQAEFIGDAMSTAAEQMNAIPIIGAIIGAVIKLVGVIISGVKGTQAINKSISSSHKSMRMRMTFENYPDPRDWVFKSMKLENYTQYVDTRKQGNWSREPCFQRAGLGTDRMFAKKAGAADVGKCGHKKGVKMKCPQKRDFGYEDCYRYYKRESKNPSSWCSRHLGISSLFFPYWSPTYAAQPIVSRYAGTDSDPNGVLMGQQVMLLTDPYSNLRVVSAKLLDMTDRFVAFWRHAMGIFSVNGKKGLLRIDKDGNAPGTNKPDRYTIDEQRDPNYSGSKSLMNRFYFDSDGRIVPYPGMSASVNEWGIRVSNGAGRGAGGGSLAVSVGAYNAVITNTLAFFTARSNMLRNGNRMRGLLMDHPKGDLDPAVRAAVQYAADKGGILPGPRPPTKQAMFQAPGKLIPTKAVMMAKKPIPKMSRFNVENLSLTDPKGGNGGTGGSAMPLLLGAAVLGFVVLKNK